MDNWSFVLSTGDILIGTDLAGSIPLERKPIVSSSRIHLPNDFQRTFGICNAINHNISAAGFRIFKLSARNLC
jgi:hypothetical protein